MKSQRVLKFLEKYNLKIAFAESMSGGRLASELVKHAGASNVFELGLVTYSNSMKEKYLNIDSKTIAKYGVVSKEVSEKMALAIQKLAKSAVSVGITGNAGPLVQENSELGEVWVSICIFEEIKSYHLQYKDLKREEIIKVTTIKIYELLEQLLKEKIDH